MKLCIIEGVRASGPVELHDEDGRLVIRGTDIDLFGLVSWLESPVVTSYLDYVTETGKIPPWAPSP